MKKAPEENPPVLFVVVELLWCGKHKLHLPAPTKIYTISKIWRIIAYKCEL